MKDLFALGEGPLLVLLDDAETAEKLLPAVTRGSLLAFPAEDWDRELTPWPAPGLGKGRETFGGQGESFLRGLLAAVEEAKAALPAPPTAVGLMGYSLAGLFALWAGTRTEAFSLLASVSGSLWYDGWCEYLEAHPCRAGRVYLSLGDREPKTRNPRMGRVGDCAERTEELLKASGAETVFEWNPGGHFNDPEGRVRRAVAWLLGESGGEA